MDEPETDGFVGAYPLWTCACPDAPHVPLRLGYLVGCKPFVGLFTDEDLIDRFLSRPNFSAPPKKLRVGSVAELLLALAHALQAGASHVIFDPAAKGGAAQFTGHIGQLVEQIGKELQLGRRSSSRSASA